MSREEKLSISQTHASLNETLDIKYHKVVQIIEDKVKNRDPKQLLGLSFDKWTSTDNTKFWAFSYT